MMDQFDGIQQHDAFLQNVGNDSYVPQAQSRRNQRPYMVAGGALVAALLLTIVIATRSGSNDTAAPLFATDTPNSDNTSDNGKYTFTARHPPAGIYKEVVTMNVVEDMSTIADGLLGDSFAMELEMDSIKTMTDRTDHREQSVKVHLTRVKSHIAAGTLEVDCDSDQPPTDAMDQLLCDSSGTGGLGEDLEYIIDESGTITPVGHSVETVDKSRLAKNPVQHVTNKLKFLPEGPVAIGDTWQSRVVLGDIGDFVGTTTLKRFEDCGDGINRCALISSVGTSYVDTREAASTLGMSKEFFDDLTVRESTMKLNMLWDEANGMIHLSKTTLDFTIVVDNDIFGASGTEIPVHEDITMKTERQNYLSQSVFTYLTCLPFSNLFLATSAFRQLPFACSPTSLGGAASNQANLPEKSVLTLLRFQPSSCFR